MSNITETPNPVVQTGLSEFALLRAHLDRMESDQAGVRRGEGGGDAAPVTAAVTRRRKTKGATMTVQPNTPGANAPTFESLLEVATKLGEEAGKGKDTQIKFDLKVLEAAYLGTLSLYPDKHGVGRRDGVLLAEAYVKAQSSTVIFDAKAPAGRKLISNVDKMIKLGSNPKWGPGQPLQVVNELVTFRQMERKDPNKAKKLDDAHNMLMRFATAQLKSDLLIDGDQMKAFAYRPTPETKTVEEVLEAIRKTANKLKNGKIPHCSDMDTSPEVQAIINACTKRLTAIAKARGGQPNVQTN